MAQAITPSMSEGRRQALERRRAQALKGRAIPSARPAGAQSVARPVEDAAGGQPQALAAISAPPQKSQQVQRSTPAAAADGLATLWAPAGRAEGMARPFRAWARRRSRACRLPSDILGVIACAMGNLSLDYGFRYPAIASARAEHHELGALRLRVVVVAHQADVVIGIRPMAGFEFRHH